MDRISEDEIRSAVPVKRKLSKISYDDDVISDIHLLMNEPLESINKAMYGEKSVNLHLHHGVPNLAQMSAFITKYGGGTQK